MSFERYGHTTAYQSGKRDKNGRQNQPTAWKSRPEIEIVCKKLETDGQIE